MAQWTISNLVSFLLDSQTDADSPTSERLMKMIRWMLEGMFLSGYATGDSGSATSDPPNDTTGVLTDTGASYDTDEHNGRTLLITSGLADGKLFTIDDTTSTTLVCTGDNLYSEGVRSGDTYIIFYDILVNADGHNHDGVNSAEVVLADAQVTQAKLKTAQSSASSSPGGGNDGYLTIPGGQYSFSHQFKFDQAVTGLVLTYGHDGDDAGPTSYVQRLNFHPGSDRTAYVQSRYVQSSGEVFWIMIKRNKTTKEIIDMYQGPDHPCFGHGGDPVAFPHPFYGYDPSIHEIIVINPSFNEVAKIKTDAQKNNLDPLEVIANDYDIDDSVEVAWPDKGVSVDLEEDFYTGKKTVKKMKIPKPQDFKCYKFKKKGS